MIRKRIQYLFFFQTWLRSMPNPKDNQEMWVRLFLSGDLARKHVIAFYKWLIRGGGINKMGFRDLKQALDGAGVFTLDGSVIDDKTNRKLFLMCLFEIAGNLDTIALCQRAVVEQNDKLIAIQSAVLSQDGNKEDKPKRKR